MTQFSVLNSLKTREDSLLVQIPAYFIYSQCASLFGWIMTPDPEVRC